MNCEDTANQTQLSIMKYYILHLQQMGGSHSSNESESVIIDESTDQEMSPLTTTQSNQSTALSEANTYIVY